MNRILSSIFLTALLTTSVFAQTGATITGKISGWLMSNKSSFENTTVILISEETGKYEFETKTDKDGNFRFENIPAGTYTVWANFGEVAISTPQTGLSFLQIEARKEVTVSNGDSAEVNLVVREPRALAEVVVVASGTEQTVDEVSKSVNVIEGQEMRDRADFALIESLRTIPGFRVQQLGGFGKTANIKVRGLRNQDTAVLIDGIRFRDASAITGDASAFLSDFTLTSVSRLEILRGSGSSLYGTNAIGGVLDFQTPQPPKGFHGQLSTVFGGLGFKRVRGNVSNETDNGKFGFNLGVSRTIYSEGIDKDDDAHNTNALGRIEFNPFSRTNISARFYVGDSFVKLNSNPDTIEILPASNSQIIPAVPLSIAELDRYATGVPIFLLNSGNANFIPDTNDPDAFQKSQFFGSQFALTHAFSNRLILQTSYQFLRTSRKNTNGVLGIGFQPFGGAEQSGFGGLIHTFNTHLNWTANENNLITVGYEYEWEKFTNKGSTPVVAGNFETRARQSSNTIYGQDQLNFFNRRLQISFAGRVQFFSLKTPQFSSVNAPYQNINLENPPTAYTSDASIAYFFESTKTKIRAHVGNGYRVPSLYERFGTFYATFIIPNAFVPLGDPRLKPERSNSFDGGIDQYAFGNRLKLSATYFYTRLLDTIGFGSLPQPDPFGRDNFLSGGGFLNTKGGISRGAEFSGEVKATSSTDIFASYTFTNSDQRVPQVMGSGVLQTLGVPAHQFTLVATQRFGKRFNVNFDFLATSSYPAPIFDTNNFTFQHYIYRFKGARRGDLSATYEIPTNEGKLRFRLYGTIENVFGYDYYENGFRTIGRTARAGFGVNF